MELFTYIRILIPKFKFLHEFRKWLVYVQISSFLGRQKQNIFLFSEKRKLEVAIAVVVETESFLVLFLHSKFLTLQL